MPLQSPVEHEQALAGRSHPGNAGVRFRVMGSEAHVVVTDDHGAPAPNKLLDQAEQRLHELEAHWSRFIDDSEISRLNRADGPLPVSADTFRLVELAIVGWERTAGRFDPTVHDAVIAAGYDRWSGSTGAMAPVELHGPPQGLSPGIAPGCAQIRLDHDRRTIELPPGVRFDPGGIGKGLAADLVTDELIRAGAAGALVSLGGDLRVRGVAPDPHGWIIDVREPTVAEGTIARLVLRDGGVATSTTERRQWTTGAAEGQQPGELLAHHLIDPATGRPYDRAVRLATAVTRDAWWAEVSTKQLFGLPTAELDNLLVDAAAIVVAADGSIHRSATFKEFESCL